MARAFAFQRQHAESEPGDQRAGSAVAGRIYRDYLSKHSLDETAPTLPQFIENLAKEESVTNEHRGPHRAFWAYESELEGADRPVPNRFLARACGESRGLQVLEDTPAGHRLNSYALGNELVMDALAQHFDFDPDELDASHGRAWDTLSVRYAEATEGLAIGFAADITRESVLGKIEVPLLLQKSEVGKEGIKFATPLPRHEHLPPEINAFMADDPVRCQLRLGDDDPEKSPEDFARKLAAIDVPENQKAAHQQILDRLSSAKTYDELNTQPPEPEQRATARTNSFLPGVTIRPTAAPPTPRGPSTQGVTNPVAAEVTPKPVSIDH